MFPIRDHNPSGRTPFVTWLLLAANIGVFLTYGFESDARVLSGIYTTWGLQPAELWRGQDLHGLVTSMFLHAGWMHLIGNMLFLWIFGDNLEDQLGHGGFLAFYLIGGLLAAGGQVLSAPTSSVPMVGASGAIAAVLGGYLLLFPKARIDVLLILVVFFKVFTVPAWVMLGLWFAFQVGNGLVADASAGGVAYWAHAGGFVAGIVMIWPFWLRQGGTQFWANFDMHPPHPETFARTSIPRSGRRR